MLDLWRYRQTGPQGDVVEEVVVRGWLNSNHRDNLLALALDHGGVMRIAPATVQADLASGRLVPALLDWEMMDPPPLALYFRPELRRTLRLRVFADFAAALCTELSQITDAKGRPASTAPGLAPRQQPTRFQLVEPPLSLQASIDAGAGLPDELHVLSLRLEHQFARLCRRSDLADDE